MLVRQQRHDTVLVLSIIEARNSSPDKLANKQLQNYHLNSRSGRFGIAATSAAKYTNRIYIETWRVVAFQNMRSTTAQTAVLYVEIALNKKKRLQNTQSS